MTDTIVSTRTLNDGHQMPRLGLGVWQSRGGDEVVAVRAALEAGYRHIDTAAVYENEVGVGRAIADSGVARGELFVTTKVWVNAIREGRARQAAEQSLKRLGLDYVDLLLLHWPVEGGPAAWKALEAIQRDGLARSIGVSNYMTEHLEALLADATVVPAVNQVELHPYLQQRDVVELCRRHGIAVEGWSPLMQGHFKDEPLLTEIARAHGKSAPQVLVRWALDNDFITIPKSVHPERVAQNADVFGFALSAEERAQIDALERGKRFGPDPRRLPF